MSIGAKLKRRIMFVIYQMASQLQERGPFAFFHLIIFSCHPEESDCVRVWNHDNHSLFIWFG